MHQARVHYAGISVSDSDSGNSSDSGTQPDPPSVPDSINSQPSDNDAVDPVENLPVPDEIQQNAAAADDVANLVAEQPQEPETVTPMNYRAVTMLPSAIKSTFRTLFGRAAREIISKSQQDTLTQKDVIALYSMPILIGHARGQRNIRQVKRMLCVLLEDEQVLPRILIEAKRVAQRPQHARRTTAQGVKRRVTQLVDAGLPGKAVRFLESARGEGLAAMNDDTRFALLQLHPDNGDSELPVLQFQEPNVRANEITKVELLEALDKTPKLSAAGVSGWTFDLIRSLLDGNDEVTQVSVELLNELLTGRVKHADIWLRSRLVPLRKPGGGVRPIAIGEAWPRLLGRLLAARYAKTFAQALTPIQVGVGVRGGVEIAAHMVQAASLSVQQQDDFVIQSIDFSNAFNSIDRVSVYRAVEQHVPQLLGFFRWSYGCTSPLLIGDDLVCRSASGVRQGDPLGPAFFALGLQPLLQEVKEEFPDVTVIAYLDDVYFMGPRIQAISARQSLARLAQRANLMVNQNKSVLLDNEDGAGLKALGTAVGSDNYVDEFLTSQLQNKCEVVKDIVGFEARYAFPMLQASISARPMYWARTSHPDRGDVAFESFDGKIDWALTQICDTTQATISETGKILRGLPFPKGGLSMRRLQDVRRYCWAASFGSALPMCARQLTTCGDTLNQLVDKLRLIVPGTLVANAGPLQQHDPNVQAPQAQEIEFPKQKQLLQDHDGREFERLLHIHDQSPIIQSWLRSNACLQSGMWLFHPKYLALPDKRYRTALQLRLLQPAVDLQPGEHLHCPCGHCSSANALEVTVHTLGCATWNQMRQHRHNDIRDNLAKMLKSTRIGAHVRTEVDLPRRDGHHGPVVRCDVRFAHGADVSIFDVAVTNPAARHALDAGSANEEAVAAKSMEEQKKRQYAVALEAAGLAPQALKPVIFETSGRPSPNMVIADWLTTKLPDDVERAKLMYSSFLDRSSAAIWRYNALIVECLLGTPNTIRQGA